MPENQNLKEIVNCNACDAFDPKIVSSPILVGIVHLLNQHDTIAALEKRKEIKAIEDVRHVRVETKNYQSSMKKAFNVRRR